MGRIPLALAHWGGRGREYRARILGAQSAGGANPRHDIFEQAVVGDVKTIPVILNPWIKGVAADVADRVDTKGVELRQAFLPFAILLVGRKQAGPISLEHLPAKGFVLVVRHRLPDGFIKAELIGKISAELEVWEFGVSHVRGARPVG